MSKAHGTAVPLTSTIASSLTRELKALLDCCPGCGWATTRIPCPGCGDSPIVDDEDALDPHSLLGRQVRASMLSSSESGVVVEIHQAKVTILRTDGGILRAPTGRCRVTQTPPGMPLVRSPSGALMAAALGLGLPPIVSQQVHRRALAMTRAAPGGLRALARDCVALGRADVIAGLSLPDTERVWWSARAMWTIGQYGAMVGELLNLPTGRYPGRILLWWSVATAGLLPETLRPAVIAATRELAPASPAAAVAASLLLRSVGERTGVASDAELVNAVRSLAVPSGR